MSEHSRLYHSSLWIHRAGNIKYTTMLCYFVWNKYLGLIIILVSLVWIMCDFDFIISFFFQANQVLLFYKKLCKYSPRSIVFYLLPLNYYFFYQNIWGFIMNLRYKIVLNSKSYQFSEVFIKFKEFYNILNRREIGIF